MESSHKRFLFTIDLQCIKKITSEHSKRVCFFFSLHCNEWIKIVEVIFMVRCFYFMHTNLISHFNANKRLWMYIFRPIRDTNKSTSRSNSQYVWDKYYYAYIFFSVNKTDTFGPSHSRMFGNKLHSSLPRGFPWFQATHLQTPVLTRD